MNYEILINIIKKQVIRSFAVLDAWFDHDLAICHGKPSGLSTSVIIRLTDVIHTNDHLLKEIHKGAADPSSQDTGLVTDLELAGIAGAAEDFATFSAGIPQDGCTELFTMRERLRDQLYDCLLLLDLPTSNAGLRYQTSFRVNNGVPFNGYQLIYFMAMLIQKEAKELDQVAGSDPTIRQREVTDAFSSGLPLK